MSLKNQRATPTPSMYMDRGVIDHSPFETIDTPYRIPIARIAAAQAALRHPA